jgi:membrane associated rhomboid family serine protease
MIWRKPSKPVLALMGALFFIWLSFAIALNWGGGGAAIFKLLRGDSSAVLHGQIWRLLTAAFVHTPTGPGAVSHILFVLLMLYFFIPSLEEQWGTKRLFTFLAGSAVFAYGVESLMFLVLPTVAAANWWGAMILADAAVVAWAVANRGQVIRLFFVLPIKPMMMVAFMVGLHVLQLITRQMNPEGMFAPFAAMGAGYLFGGDSAPVRRAYLKWKLSRLQREVDNMQKKSSKKAKRAKASHLRVIDGGRPDDDDPVLH